MIRTIESSPIVILGSNSDGIMVAYISDQMEEPVDFRAFEPMTITEWTQAPVKMKVSVAGLHMMETQPHLTTSSVNMIARGISETLSRVFTVIVTNWSNTPFTVPKNMLVAQSTPASNIFERKTNESDGINMTQLH